MGMEWYDMIAKRNGGYRGRAKFKIEGISAEQIYEEQLIRMLPACDSVLDAGCGHGEFTLQMAAYAARITGFDNSKGLLAIATRALASSGVTNVDFVYATTKTELPFEDGQFDLIYDRRGPTSILEHKRVLRKGGVVFGIHTDVSKVKERLLANQYDAMEIREFNDAWVVFPDETQFALFLSDAPGNPDYTVPEMREQLELRVRENTVDGRIAVRERKYIWRAENH